MGATIRRTGLWVGLLGVALINGTTLVPLLSTEVGATLGSPIAGQLSTLSAPLAQAASCVDPATPIHDVQGNGSASPLVGQNVTIQAIVVGDFQPDDGDAFNTNLGGFYLQEAPSEYDADPNTSEGVFVYTGAGAPNVVAGDEVRVSGSVGEINTHTEIDARGGSIVDCGDRSPPPPEPVLLQPNGPPDALERFEGMLVDLTQSLSVSEYVDFERFGEIVLCAPSPLDPPAERDRLYQPTSIDPPGSTGAAARAEYNQTACITLDDGRSNQNPDPARHPNGQEFTLANRFRGGDSLQHTIGVLDYRFGLYRIQPTTGATHSPANPRPEQPPAVGGDLRVASFNVLNYFTTLTTAGAVCGPARNQECRGANTAEEFGRQRAKIIEALFRLNADVVGLIELENTDDVAIENLVDGLNARFGATTYNYIDTGTIGADAIRVALIYKPARVTPAGAFQTLDGADDPRFNDTRSRPALAQTFDQAGSNARFTAVINHFKSKASACGGPPDDDPEQGNCNGTRTLAAEALVDWLAGDPTGSNDPDFLIIGDLNAYDKEDPIRELRAGADDTPGTADDYTDLELRFGGEHAYSYVFDGQFGYLDHALAIASLVPQVSGTQAWHINADEPDILDYDMTNKQPAQDALYDDDPFRSADHDPVLVGLALAAATPTPTTTPITATPSPTPTPTATATIPPPLPARVWIPVLERPVTDAPPW